jgi:hypothetical protein
VAVTVGVRVGVGVALGVAVGVGVAGTHSVRVASSGALSGLERKKYLFVARLLAKTPSLRRDVPLLGGISLISDVVGVPDVSVYW